LSQTGVGELDMPSPQTYNIQVENSNSNENSSSSTPINQGLYFIKPASLVRVYFNSIQTNSRLF